MDIFHWLFGRNSQFAKWFGYYKHDEPTPQPEPIPEPIPVPEPPKPEPPPFPKAPTRDQVCAMKLKLQGMTVATKQFGDLPWFEAALAWLNPEDRQSVYTTKKVAGDTHCIIEVPNGFPLYDEPNQPYSADRFGPLDWTNGETAMDPKFVELVVEVIQAGFIPVIFMDERMEHSYKCMPLVINVLKAHTPDLTDYCLIMPGWDGVFYGWEPSGTVIPGWAAQARALGAKYLGLEFNIGHIPLGEGGGDFQPGGRMKDFDVILGEFNYWEAGQVPGDQVWQIVGRLISPYHRPADQPAGDDPNPPYYLSAASPRGPFYFIVYECGEYEWVRSRASVADMKRIGDYFRALGAEYVCI